jgi:glycerol-3-phosphate dehydrogenase (NAD(P)+)
VLKPDTTFISLMKGVELGSSLRMSEVISEVTGASASQVAVVSGPNLAGEIMRREPTATVVACPDEGVAQRIQRLMHTPRFRPYRSVDVIGCELGGAYKNVIGLCVGMAVGLGFGDNTTASITTRGLAETARLGRAIGADPLTLMGLAGMGDLVATCSSPLSRNRTFGEKLGQGFTAAQIFESTRQVAEGAKSCASIAALAREHDVYAPIAHHVDAVVRGEIKAKDLIDGFDALETKRERD